MFGVARRTAALLVNKPSLRALATASGQWEGGARVLAGEKDVAQFDDNVAAMKVEIDGFNEILSSVRAGGGEDAR